MDHLSQGYLAALHIRDLLDDAEARRTRSPGTQAMPRVRRPIATRVYSRLRRRLGTLLIRAGHRLAGCDPSPAYRALGSAHR